MRRWQDLPIIAVLMGYAATGSVYAQEYFDTDRLWQEQRHAVVAIRVVGRDALGRPKVVPGTGVFIRPNAVLTAKHVIGREEDWYRDGGIGPPDRRIEVWGLDDHDRKQKIGETTRDRPASQADLTLVTLAEKGYGVAAMRNAALGDKLYSFGMLAWSNSDQLTPRTFKRLPNSSGNGDTLIIDYRSLPGDSGSPIFDADGFVVGLLSWEGHDPATSLAEPIYLAIPILPPLGPDVASPKPPPKLPDPWQTIDHARLETLTEEVAAVASRRVPYPDDFVVSGEKYWSDQALLARRIVFEPGAQLVFADSAAESSLLVVAAEEIVSLSLDQPGIVTWESAAPPDPVDRGNAASGAPGKSDGDNGQLGAAGEPGLDGPSGRNAPHLSVLAKDVKGALIVDLSGQLGGRGGTGQTGGRGGDGAAGQRASQSAFDCKRGPGDGGRGGDGGIGGKGGKGGTGGGGGMLTFLTDEPQAAQIASRIVVRLVGGPGGQGGEGGRGGDPGAGGRRGAPASPYCKDDGKDGPRGRNGDSGQPGSPGNSGNPGTAELGTLSTSQIIHLVSR